MKYTNLRIGPNLALVETARVCSHCKSGVPLRGTENFCPDCGARLKHIPCKLDKEAIIALVNENIDKLPKPPKVPKIEDWVIANDHCSTKGGTEDHDGWIVPAQGQGIVCPHGRGLPEDCGFCTRKGACTFTVLTSIPPQYNICPFHGSGFIRCSEAE